MLFSSTHKINAALEADHDAQFRDTESIDRERERFAAMRLQTPQLEFQGRTRRRNGDLGCNDAHARVCETIKPF